MAAALHDDSRSAVDERRPAERSQAGAAGEHELRHVDGAGDGRSGTRTASAGVDAEHDVGVEHRKQGVEVARTRGDKKGVDDLALAWQVGVGGRRCALHAAPAAARELPGRGRSPADDRGDLLEGDGEHVVQHESEPLCGRERFEDDEEREAD